MFLLACAAFLMSGAVIIALWPVCLRLGHVDRPGGRKKHADSTPLSGGIGIAAAILLCGAVVAPSFRFAGFAIGVCTLLLLGAMDDRKHVSAPIRLALQTLAVSLGMCFIGEVTIDRLGNLAGFGDVYLDQWAVAFTVFAAVGVINAVNMIDGMDGLAGGFAALLFGVLLLLVSGNGSVSVVLLCLSLGSVFGFLAFNLRMPWQPRARVFLGDAGSLVLGFILVWFSIEASQAPDVPIRPITIVWLFGLPLCDTVYLMAARVFRGKSPLAADRYHFHHLLQRLGLSPGWALYAWLTVAAIFMAVGVGADVAGVPEWVMFYSFITVFAAYCGFMNRLWSPGRLRRRIART